MPAFRPAARAVSHAGLAQQRHDPRSARRVSRHVASHVFANAALTGCQGQLRPTTNVTLAAGWGKSIIGRDAPSSEGLQEVTIPERIDDAYFAGDPRTRFTTCPDRSGSVLPIPLMSATSSSDTPDEYWLLNCASVMARGALTSPIRIGCTARSAALVRRSKLVTLVRNAEPYLSNLPLVV